ncbi:hypothetical protein [Allomuricauda sp. d1]|uniref:Kelch repeat-containing protein n=1 Tax=Allomuricauda sp. d1 TaxID=3136725 RepID=UPI0031DB67EC
MKTRIISSVLAACLLWACSKDDGNNEPSQAQNSPPEAFDLIGVTDNAVAVDVAPTFTWQSANDPDGDTVSYDLYLGTETEPSTLFAENISGASFTVQERLSLITEYHWKVVAKDGKGGTVESVVNSFTTRNLNIPNAPVTAAADFTARTHHSTVIFDDKLWIIGGIDNVTGPKNDVWYSTDGITWAEATPAAAFPERFAHSVAVFDNKLWVIGGDDVGAFKNDVWYSTDGVNWNEATPAAGYVNRAYHSSAVFDNKIWVIGGLSNINGFRNDVWYSTDGVNWTEATPSAGFSERYYHTTVVFDGKLWVIGGVGTGGVGATSVNNEVWYSTDGTSWAEATQEADFSARSRHTTAVFDNKMWVIGGEGEDINAYKDDMWYSVDGITWEEIATPANFPKRANHTVAAFSNKLWVIGGRNVISLFNDVWAMD